MDYYRTKSYVNYLNEIVKTFNTRVNRTIKLTPREAYLDENHATVLHNLERYYMKTISKRKKVSKFKTGDRVRIINRSEIYKGGGIQKKGYKQVFSNEIYRIVRVDKRLPITRYILNNINEEGDSIGSFVKSELSKVV